MKVFVAGATGALGIPLVRQLASKNYVVIGLTRSPAKRQLLERLGATAVIADALDASTLEQVVRDASPTHVVHLLTALPKNGPLRASDLKTTNVLRTVGTANLLRAAIAAGVKRIVGESFILAYGYGNYGGRMVNEADALQEHESNVGFQEAVDAIRSLENQLLEANQRGLIEAVSLRYGVTYGPENPSTHYMIRMLRKRLLPMVRGAQGVLSFIHTTDAASATLAALERGRPGEIYNIGDDEPTSMNEFFIALANAIGAHRPFSIPLWLMRWSAPFMADLLSMRLAVSNAKAKRDLGWSLQFPNYRVGLQQVAAQAQIQ